ncbi:MAG: CDP-alcohol phosphatidyltransferase family protein [Gammaproteobacteria bacterium]|nr:CDP-alcohol phosphatidyltransferase family protein [Gammaproteobacteria bacterium]
MNRYYAHLIDPFFTKLVYDLGLSPNSVTLVALLLGVGSAVALLNGALVWAAILLQLHHFFDGADGNLARLTNRCSAAGARLDRLSDQLVRVAVFVAVAIAAKVDGYLAVAFVATLYLDFWVVHRYVLPCLKRVTIHPMRWKKWFLDRGIIPGYDHFTIFFLISLTALFDRLDIVIYLTLVLKNMEWIYRLGECYYSQKLGRSQADV